jgi:LDH2 family malate/lactate/ureidoglycolate dehydrogenase
MTSSEHAHPRVPAARLQEVVETIFRAAGQIPEHARIAAGSLVDADLNGTHSHGSRLTAHYLPQLLVGAINPRPDIRISRDEDATALIDGDAGMGHITGTLAMEKAIGKAAALGIGVVGVGNSTHFGAAGRYAAMALAHDMVGFATTNSPPCLPPTGGVTPRVGNNPVAYAIPSGAEPPIILDMALSVVARAKISMAQQANQKIPLDWAFDAGGHPTDDPTVALGGMLAAIGGYKGFGLAVVMDVLCGIMTGSDFGPHLGKQDDPTRHENAGHFFIAIDVGRFRPVDEFKARTDQMIREIRESTRREGVERIYLPGEIEWRRRQERLAEGIPLPAGTLADIERAAKMLDLSIDLFG